MSGLPVLLLGGPKDGEILAIQHFGDIAVAEVDEVSLFASDREDPVATITPKIGYYLTGRVAMFGHLLAVFAWHTLTEHDKERLAFQHLASDAAKSIVIRSPA